MKRAFYRSIPIYYDEITHEAQGRNWLYDLLLEFNIWFDFKILNLDELPIYVEED